MSAPQYRQLSNCQNFGRSESLETLRSLLLNFPINELTNDQLIVLECVVDERKPLPIYQIVTYRFCERVEFCSENGVFLLVTRYIEVDPFSRQIIPKKTVRVIPSFYSVEMYLKNYGKVLKL